MYVLQKPNHDDGGVKRFRPDIGIAPADVNIGLCSATLRKTSMEIVRNMKRKKKVALLHEPEKCSHHPRRGTNEDNILLVQ
jgi:hypothetical protein